MVMVALSVLGTGWGTVALAQQQARAPAAPVDPLTAGRDSMANGEPSEAIAQYQRALQLNPDDPVALNNLAVAEAANGDYRPALDLLTRAAALAPGRADIAANLAQYRRWLDQHSGVSLLSPSEDNAPVGEDAAGVDIPPLWSGDGTH